jgi:hypothetical protein
MEAKRGHISGNQKLSQKPQQVSAPASMPLVKMFHLPGSLGHEAGADTCWGFWESFWFPEMCPLFASIFQSGEGDN